MKVWWSTKEVPSDNEEFYVQAISNILPALPVDLLWLLWREACRDLEEAGDRPKMTPEELEEVKAAAVIWKDQQQKQKDNELFKLKSSLEDGVSRAETVQSMLEILLNATTGDNAITEEVLQSYMYQITSVADEAIDKLHEAKELLKNMKQ